MTDATTSDPRPDYIHVGTDAAGAHHVYLTATEEVVVVAEGRRVHRQALEGRSINAWMDCVTKRRG